MQNRTIIVTIIAVVFFGVFVGIPTITQNVSAESDSVPSWIKNTASFWVDGNVSDTEFLNAMEFLIGEGIIQISRESVPVVDTITIGFIPVEKADELTPKAEALEKFLEEKLVGVDIEIVIPTNYEIIIEDTLGKRVAFTSITGSSGFVKPMGTLVTSGYVNIQGDDIVALESALVDSFEAYTFAGGYKAALELLLNDNVDVAFGSDIAPQKYLDQADQAKRHDTTKL